MLAGDGTSETAKTKTDSMRSWARAMSRSVHIQLFVILSGRLGSCRTATVSKDVWKTRWKGFPAHEDEAGKGDRHAGGRSESEGQSCRPSTERQRRCTHPMMKLTRNIHLQL